MAAGIRTRHGRSCRSRDGGRCNCTPSYEAWVYSKRDDKKIRKTFKTLAEAKAWRTDAGSAVRQRVLRAPSKVTLAEAASEWLERAQAGRIRSRSGARYKPGTLRRYEQVLRLHVLDGIGAHRLADISHFDLRELRDRLQGDDLDARTIHVIFAAIGVIYGRAIEMGQVAVNPVSSVTLPRPDGRRTRIAPPEEATRLLAALPEEDRPIWAMAMYAGLRRGELRALRWEDVDLGANRIRVERGWDDVEGDQGTKSGRARIVPIFAKLRPYLEAQRIRTPDPDGLVFGRGSVPFAVHRIRARALAAWEAAKLEPLTLHDARHTAASVMIASGVNVKAISEYMGHSSISITVDVYGHLMPGWEDEAADLVNAYLARVEGGG